MPPRGSIVRQHPVAATVVGIVARRAAIGGVAGRGRLGIVASALQYIGVADGALPIGISRAEAVRLAAGLRLGRGIIALIGIAEAVIEIGVGLAAGPAGRSRLGRVLA